MLITTIIALLFFILLSLPISAVLGVMGIFLDATFSSLPLSLAFGEVLWNHSRDFLLVIVPLFILMGEIILHAGIAHRMYAAIAQWLSWLPGGLMHANIGTCALFAATSGSSTATAATISVLALPEVDKRGYNERIFLGSLAAGGTLGILIPPSINMIVFAALTNTSIPQLFLAGIIPGVILTLLYMLVIIVLCLYRRDWGGRPVETSWRLRFKLLPDLVPPILLFIIVIGSIYAGFATPTEAASLGVIGSLILAAWYKSLSWRMLGAVLEGTIRTGAMITLILMCSFVLNFAVAAIGLVEQINTFILGLGWTPLGTMLFIIGIYIIMGMVMDALPMVVLTVPILAPVVFSLGYDPVWFGIVVVLVSEASILTPPVGILCYVIQGIRGRGSLNDVFYGVAPFLVALGTMIGLIVAYPQLALWIPTMMYR
jgi:C4-dicarboxylate transporter DctM subunit